MIDVAQLAALAQAEQQIGGAALLAAAKLPDGPERRNLRTVASIAKVRIKLIEGLLK